MLLLKRKLENLNVAFTSKHKTNTHWMAEAQTHWNININTLIRSSWKRIVGNGYKDEWTVNLYYVTFDDKSQPGPLFVWRQC